MIRKNIFNAAGRPAPLSLADVEAAMDKIRFCERTLPPYMPDVLLLSRAAREKIAASVDPYVVEQTAANQFCGIAFEVRDTLLECVARACELKAQGKKVAVLFDDPE
jgi:hypothetical protein